ncbi:MAG: hypothetical protein HQL15_03860 [Candidatus Omnitrophica bacterium]|nr:hypothetical protein [Candidatus Omnitrophota bacterium]
MPYDATLDASTFKEVIDFQNTRLTVGVFSYNGAPKKLQISRENLIEEKWSFTKLGRLNKEEAQAVAPIIMKAIETM